MHELTASVIPKLRESLPKSAKDALPRIVGGSTAGGGIWRLFSPQKSESWNSAILWRDAWPGLLPDLFFFGEDIFGNQLTLHSTSENVWLWNHEDGNLVDLLLDAATLLETVLQSGLDWIDFYSPQMLSVGRSKLLDVPDNCHLHWMQPLILGGKMTTANASMVESVMHLRGHGRLWAQIRGLPQGTEVIFKPPSKP